MRKSLPLLIAVAAALVLSGVPAAAQSTADLTVSAAVNARASLTLSDAGVAFADADPDVTANITGAPVLTVTAKSRTSNGNAVTLTVQAATALTSGGGDTIAASNVTWAATGDLSAGTLDTAAVTIGNWSNSGSRSGNMTFSLVNSWAYATGNYSTTVTYTLSAP
jgi:hypothetical protein